MPSSYSSFLPSFRCVHCDVVFHSRLAFEFPTLLIYLCVFALIIHPSCFWIKKIPFSLARNTFIYLCSDTLEFHHTSTSNLFYLFVYDVFWLPKIHINGPLHELIKWFVIFPHYVFPTETRTRPVDITIIFNYLSSVLIINLKYVFFRIYRAIFSD